MSGHGYSRREALAIMGLLPLATMLDTTPAAADRIVRLADAARQDPSFEPTFFTPHEWRTVRVLVDLIIPRDARSGSATDAGVPEFMDFTMTDRAQMQTQMRGGLHWLDAESRRRFDAPFADTPAERQRAILDDIAFPARARPEMSHGVAFFNYFRDLAAAGFFSSEMGVRDIQYMGNQFLVEWKGCPPEALERLGVSYG